MRPSPRGVAPIMLALSMSAAVAQAPHAPAQHCATGIIEGELEPGRSLTHPIGGGLELFVQPIASGWIIRIKIKSTGPQLQHDAAEIATPPYQSVSPLSLSTDFALRAQDAIAWNPRRFRFATSIASLIRLSSLYDRITNTNANNQPSLDAELTQELSLTSSATLHILDARLTPGTADPGRTAQAVAQHLESTAHTDIPPPNGQTTPLGRLLWLRFRLQLALPANFKPDPSLKLEPRLCAMQPD